MVSGGGVCGKSLEFKGDVETSKGKISQQEIIYWMGAASRDFNCVGVQMPEKNFEYTEKGSGYIHQLKFKLNGKEFELPVAFSDSNDVPPILGRVKGLDLFDATFLKGQKVKLAWE